MIEVKTKIKELCDYKSIDLSGVVEPFSMSEEEISQKIQRLRKKYARTVDGDKVEREDFVTLSCTSTLPKFSKEKITVRVGAGLFSSELEEGLLSLSVNEEKLLTADGAGVTVKILDIKRRVLAELNDETVKTFGIDGVESVSALREHIYSAEKGKYIEEYAESVASYLSAEAAKRSKFEFSEEEIAEARESGEQFADEMIRSAGLDREKSTDEDFMQAVGRSKQDFIDLMTGMSVDEVGNIAIGAALMNENGVTVTEKDYEAAVAEYTQALGVTEEEARKKLPFGKFERQRAANYYFERIIEYVTEYMDS